MPLVHPTKREKPYDNCRVQDPRGNVMFYCNRDRFNWYLGRQLAVTVCDDPPTIRLTFEPKGLGDQGDAYYMNERENRCVVCGVEEGLTLHHVVPHCYRKFFPDEIKGASSHDILPLCATCHARYELEADKLKQKLAREHDAPFKMMYTAKGFPVFAVKAAHALKQHRDRMPLERVEKLTQDVSDYLGRKPNDTDIDELVAMKAVHTLAAGSVFHGQKIVEVVGIDSLNKLWRNHFLAHMTPAFLPPHWDAERPAVRVRLASPAE